MSPVQTAKSKLAAKYGGTIGKSAMAHAKDETTSAIQGVPPGIRDGIARLTSVKFDAFKTGNNAGKFYFQCQAMAVKPNDITTPTGVLKVRGRNTRVQIPVDDQKDSSGKVTSTQDEQIAKIVNQMRLLAGDEFADQILAQNAPPNIQKNEQALGLWAAETLESMAEQLNASCAADDTAIYFNFSTSERASREYLDPKTKQKKMSAAGVWENWGEACEAPSDENAGQVNDQTAAPSDLTSPETPSDISSDGTVPADAEVTADPMTPEDIEALDLPTLLELATGETVDSEGAGEHLKAMAIERGMTEDEFAAVQSFDQVIEFITNVDESAAAPVDEEWKPEVKQVYKYQVLDAKGKPVNNPKTKKPAGPIEVRVESVDVAKQTVKLKNLEDGKSLYLNQPWERLIRE